MAGPREPGAFVRVVRHDEHHEPPYLDEVLFTLYDPADGEDAQWTDLIEGQLQVAQLAPSRRDEAMELFGRSTDGYRGPGVLDGVRAPVYLYGFDVTEPPFDDARLRRAISLAIDRDAIADEVLGGLRAAADSLVPPSVPGHQPGACEYCRYDPELAAELWEAALERWQASLAEDAPPSESMTDEESPTDDVPGEQTDPFVPTITLVHPRGASHAVIAEHMAADLEASLRARINLRAESLGRFVALVGRGEARVFRLGWEPSEPDPGAYLAPLFHGREIGRDNLTGWQRDDVDELLDQAKQSMTLGAALATYRQVERIVLDEIPVMPLLYYRQSAVVAPGVDGLRWAPTGRIDLARVRLER
jgi:oligopeptide transport system substrate-binding protein